MLNTCMSWPVCGEGGNKVTRDICYVQLSSHSDLQDLSWERSKTTHSVVNSAHLFPSSRGSQVHSSLLICLLQCPAVIFLCLSFRCSSQFHGEETNSCYCPLLPPAQEKPTVIPTTKAVWRSKSCSPTVVHPFSWFSTHPEVGPKSPETKHTCVSLLPIAAITNGQTHGLNRTQMYTSQFCKITSLKWVSLG